MRATLITFSIALIMKPTVTFATKCWEGDYEFLLNSRRLENTIQRNCYDFEEKVLFINNVRDEKKVLRLAEKKIEDGTLTNVFSVEKYANEALDFFEITKDSLGIGYYYSIAELVSIYVCNTQYLLHYTGDSMPIGSINWIPDAIENFEKNPLVKVATLVWNSRYDEAKAESFSENEKFYIASGFSDQCYLIRTSDFKAPIYNYTHIESERYPKYGGELFEKRVDAWLKTHGYQRIILKSASYFHKNFPKPFWKRQLQLLLGTRTGK
jgi:hypothetical protein